MSPHLAAGCKLIGAERSKRGHLNADEKRALQAADLHRFVRQYARKAQKRIEPNDRRHDRAIEQRAKRLSPERLDRLLREDEDE